MGVFIYPCELIERVSDNVTEDEMDILRTKYDQEGKELVRVKNMNQYHNYIAPFQEGIYVYEGHNPSVDMTYGFNCDFLQSLETMSEECDLAMSFYNTLETSTIEGVAGYEIAEKMLEEFETNKEVAIKYLDRHGDSYGRTLCNIYLNYLLVLKECVKIKGIVKYA